MSSSPIEVDATTVTEEAKITATLGVASDVFGNSAIDGDTIVVGARQRKVGLNSKQGAAYVFVRSGTSWSQQAELTADDGAENDLFGQSVSISGDTIVVGAPQDNVGSNSDQGSAYIFVRSGSSWSQQARLNATGGAASDKLGTAIDISGDTVVAGAHLKNSNEGAAWVFVRTGTNWSQQGGVLMSSSAAGGDRFGISVSVSGDNIAIGAGEDYVGEKCCAGSVEVWVRSDGTWSRQTRITADDAAEGAFFGSAVSIENDTLVAGARSDTIGGSYGRGSVYVFTRSGTAWSQQAKFSDAAGGHNGFGERIDLSGDVFVVGRPIETVDGVIRKGSVFVFLKTDGTWSQKAKLTVSEGANFDQFGISVSVSGTGIVIGSTDHDTGGNNNQGAAWVFRIKEPPPPLPVIFVPGVAGSVIIDRNDGNNVLWFANSAADLQSMSRFNTVGENKVAPDLLRSVFGQKDVYGGFLDGLAAKGFREYDLNSGAVGDFATFVPSRLTSSGCDSGQTDGDGKKPNLFLFPYDWRLDNAVNAAKLDDYIDCVRQIYPDSEVNVITHSMGGLLVRRYVLDNLSDHHVDRWASVAAPWLGAPKLAFVLETGEFLDEIKHIELFKAILRDVLRSFPAVHQLLPSQAYHDLGGAASIQESGVDLDGDGVDFELFSGQDLYDLADQRYGVAPFMPGTTAKDFHTTAQDDFRLGTSGIEYFHIFGVKSSASTLEGFTSKIETVCSASIFGLVGTLASCSQQPVAAPRFTIGDGTVPRLSAQRIGSGSNLNLPGSELLEFLASSVANDPGADHNDMLQNPNVTVSLLDILAGADGRGSTEPFDTSESTAVISTDSLLATLASGGPSTNDVGDVDYHYVKVIGPTEVTVSSGSGGTTAPVNEVFAGTIPGVTVLGIGENAFMVLMPAGTSETYDLDFDAVGPISIEITTGKGGAPDEAIRYHDVNLPNGAATRLSIVPTGPQPLAHDSDGNGSLEATSSPTVILTGAAAADNEGPTITLASTTTDFIAQVSLSASDTSGVTDLFWSTDGISFTRYDGPFAMDLRASSTIYALANDGAANRSSIARTLAHSVTGSISLQGVTDQGVLSTIGPTVSVDLGSTSTSVAINADGSFDLSGLVSGTYTVTVQAPGFLPARRDSVSITSGSVSVPTFELRSGLVDGDGVVSIRDISAVAASFGATGLTDRMDGQGRIVDLNGDGDVDVLDISAVGSNFGVVSPQSWN